MNNGITSKKREPDKKILEFHITRYLNSTTKILFIILCVLTLTEFSVCLLLGFGYFSHYLHVQNNFCLQYNFFLIETITKTCLSWIIYIIFMILYKKADFERKPNIICGVFLILTTIFCYGHWKYNYLSICYGIPVVFAAPLSRKTRKLVLCISLFMCVIYLLFQKYIFNDESCFMIFLISVTVIIVFYLISNGLYDSLINILLDYEKFFLLSAKLNEEVTHDPATGAMSKIMLQSELLSQDEYKSIAFIDLDNFKEINDSKGHDMGDHILRNLVRCLKSKTENIYRYGGDEFIVVSKLSMDKFSDSLEKSRVSFASSCETLFSCEATFSAGAVAINPNKELRDLVKECDELMYLAKQEGKNFVVIKK